MHVFCQREQLLAAFQIAASVVPTRSPKAVLQHTKFQTDTSGSYLTATDLEIGLRMEIAGIETHVPGVAVLPVDRFGAILRESSEDTVELKADGNTLQVMAGPSRFELPLYSPEEFPQIHLFDDQEGYFVLQGALLRGLARKTLFATSQDTNRYDLGGVLLQFEPQSVTAVSTDGRRLAKMEGRCEAIGDPQLPPTMTIVPARSMQLMQRILGDAERVQLLVRENELLAQAPGTSFASRLLEGRFPRWEMVIPQDRQGGGIEFTVGPLLAALRQAGIVADQDSRGIDFDFREGNLVLSASVAERGKCRVPLPIPYDGPPIDVRLDCRFFEDFLKVLEPDATFLLSVKDHESAVLCTTEDGYAYVLMPLSAQ